MTAPGKNSYLGSKQENIKNQSGKLEKYQNRKNQNIREMRRKNQVLKYGVQTFLQHSQKISNALPISLRVCLKFISGYVYSITLSICYTGINMRQ